MNDRTIKPNTLLKGSLFPELVKVIAVIPMGDSLKLICEGLTTGKVHQPILTPDQIKLLEVLPSEDRPFDGDAAKFRLGIEALRLGLAYEVCYDATDIRLASDLRDTSDVFIVPALNKDVNTFDQMALALHYHMFQLVVVANNGTFGGSNAYAPYREPHIRQIFHLHGQPQASIWFLEIDNPAELINRGNGVRTVPQHNERIWKYPPAGRGEP